MEGKHRFDDCLNIFNFVVRGYNYETIRHALVANWAKIAFSILLKPCTLRIVKFLDIVQRP